MAIGETVLGAVLQVVFDRLASWEVINFFRSTKFDESLVHKLITLIISVEMLLLDAEEKQMTNNAVNLWLDELRHWFYRAEEVVNEVASEALRLSLEKELPPQPQSVGAKVRNLIPAFSDSSLFRNAITLKIREVVEMLETMLSQKDLLGLRELSVGRAPKVPSTCLLEDSKVFGRVEVKNTILDFLLSNEAGRKRISVVAIVGMGGIGKTTLAKLVFNDSRLRGTFDVKVWVCVSDQFDISQVTRSILESIADQSYPDSLDLSSLQTKLSAQLSDKRFLLVLDDVWNEKYEDWKYLQAPFSVGAYGSKIIVTTRNDKVASIMSTAPMFRLKPLSDADAWSLFSRHAFELGNSMSNSCLEDFGKKIVQKCQGLPLAVKTLGGLLRSTQENGEWEAISESSLWDLPYNKSNVIPALLLSYYHFPSNLKRCFSYCAIFPKDYKIERKQLVLLWMAENFVQPTDNERRVEDVGDEYVRQLLSRSFLEPMDDTSFVAMHHLMHDLAQVLSGDFLLRNEFESPAKYSKRARHFSYVADYYDGMTKFPAIHESKHLRPFLQLHINSFCGYENLMLPESVGCLKQLCYLDVSCTNITQLPKSVSNLYNLQTLLLSNCINLESLPADMGSLALLRHLDITGTTSLLQMPKHMGKLKSLQTLTDFVVGTTNCGSGIQELMELRQIRGRFGLRRLQNVATPDDARYANLSSKRLIDELALEFDSVHSCYFERSREVLENLMPPENLKRLIIRGYIGRIFPSWLDSKCSIYTNLTYLAISGCRCCLLPPLGQLPSMKELIISRMDCITRVGPEFWGHDDSGLRRPFPTLESLRFEIMGGWEVWSNVDDEGNAVCFPRLKKLCLQYCPKLKGNLPVHLPSLVEVVIDRCPQLGRLLPQVPSYFLGLATSCTHAELASAFDLASITTLKFVRLVQLVNLPREIMTLSSLSYFQIEQCDNLKSLANVKLPCKLRSLVINQCKFLESLPGGMAMLTRLEYLFLSGCQFLQWVPENSLPTSLTRLEVSECARLEFPIPVERMQQYTSLGYLLLWDIHLVCFPLGMFPNLRCLKLQCCEDLEKVYIPAGIEDNSLTIFSCLCIIGCPKLEVVGI